MTRALLLVAVTLTGCPGREPQTLEINGDMFESPNATAEVALADGVWTWFAERKLVRGSFELEEGQVVTTVDFHRDLNGAGSMLFDVASDSALMEEQVFADNAGSGRGVTTIKVEPDAGDDLAFAVYVLGTPGNQFSGITVSFDE